MKGMQMSERERGRYYVTHVEWGQLVSEFHYQLDSKYCGLYKGSEHEVLSPSMVARMER